MKTLFGAAILACFRRTMNHGVILQVLYLQIYVFSNILGKIFLCEILPESNFLLAH